MAILGKQYNKKNFSGVGNGLAASNTQQQDKKLALIPWIFVMFFILVLAVDITYIYISEKTWRGLATEDGYQKGLKYNETLDYIKKQKDLGFTSKIKYQPLASKSGILNFSIFDQNQKIISDANVIAIITRPVQSGYDFSLPLKFDKNSFLYNSKINFPLEGQWNIEIRVFRGETVYQDVKRLIIR